MFSRPQTNERTSTGSSPAGRAVRWPWLALLAILVLTALVRYRLLDIPLERDEGEYAYAGQLLLQGVPPYASVYNMKLPGIYGVYAVMLVLFGETSAAIHFGLLLANAGSIVLVFLLGRRIRDPVTGLVAAASFALMSVSPSVQGIFANAEQFVLPPALGGLLAALVAIDRNRPRWLFWSGVLLGTAIVMKQHGAAFAACAGLFVLIVELRTRPFDRRRASVRSGWLCAGMLAPLALTTTALLASGVFDRFRFWAVEYAMNYASQVSLAAAVRLFRHRAWDIASSAPLLWLLVAAGVIATFSDARARARLVFIAPFAVVSVLAVSVGLYFRPHYFVLALPAAALFAGLAVSSVAGHVGEARSSAVRVGIPLALTLVAFGGAVIGQREFLFVSSPTEISRNLYFPNPFAESVAIARYIRENSTAEDRIAVLGSEPQIYFYADRRSATGYVYAYPLMEEHPFASEMQEEMIREIEQARPRFIVFVGIESAWRQRPASPTRIFEWLRQYQNQHYAIVGLVDLFPGGPRYHWAPDVVWPPASRYWVTVSERRPE